MKQKALPEGKKWLLHHLAYSPEEQQSFIELAMPLLGNFTISDLTEDHYGGYAAELWLFKPQSANYEKEFSLIDQSKKTDYYGCSFAPSLLNKDDCYVMKDGILMKHHLFSFLWA